MSSKLNPQAKRVLLEQRLQHIQQNQFVSTEFLRSLVISKSFFNVARFYQIYRLDLHAQDFHETRTFTLCIVPSTKNYASAKVNNSCLSFGLNFEDAERLVQFLNPASIGVHFLNNFDETFFQAQYKLLLKTNGSIALFYSDTPSASEVAFLIERFYDRIKVLKCDGPLFFNNTITHKMSLDYCEMVALDFDHLQFLMKNVNSKHLKIVTYDGTIFGTSSNSASNKLLYSDSSSKILEVMLERTKIFDLDLKSFLKLFPRLRTFKLHINPPFWEEKLQIDQVAEAFKTNYEQNIKGKKIIEQNIQTFSSILQFEYNFDQPIRFTSALKSKLEAIIKFPEAKTSFEVEKHKLTLKLEV